LGSSLAGLIVRVTPQARPEGRAGIAGGDMCVSKAGRRCIFAAAMNNQRVTFRRRGRRRAEAGLGNGRPTLRPAISTGQDVTIKVPGK
jgi:hypothetical protein